MSLRVHHVSCGTMCPFGKCFVEGHGSPFATARIHCHVLVVETNDGILLVDTGIGAKDVLDRKRLGFEFNFVSRPTLDPAETAIARIEALGFRQADVRHLVSTHLDVDHAGGLPDFPDAAVHVLEAELHAALESKHDRYRQPQFEHGPKWQTYGAGGETWMGFEAVRPLTGTGDDVLLIPLPGHTPGQAGVAVRGENGWILHAGDAYFSHLEMLPKPKTPLGLAIFQRRLAFDNALRLKNQERLRALVRDRSSEVRVVSAHCPVELRRELERAQRDDVSRGAGTGRPSRAHAGTPVARGSSPARP
ncbi:MAG TPA: MBL fold metallo-hydrolase [Polyangiaceae bacterium]